MLNNLSLSLNMICMRHLYLHEEEIIVDGDLFRVNNIILSKHKHFCKLPLKLAVKCRAIAVYLIAKTPSIEKQGCISLDSLKKM